MVEEEEEERLLGRPGLRLRGFRRPRPRPRFRPPSRLRPHLQDNEERELEEMMAALGENSPLKAEFEKFMKEQLGAGTGPRRLAQLIKQVRMLCLDGFQVSMMDLAHKRLKTLSLSSRVEQCVDVMCDSTR